MCVTMVTTCCVVHILVILDVLFARYKGDHISLVEMGGACSSHGEGEKCVHNLC
jgi:hypothetical protein